LYQQVFNPLAHSLNLSALFAALPLLVLFVLLGVLRVRAWVAGLTGLALALVVAIAVYGMPLGQALLAASDGGAFGLFPAMWIVLNAIWVYRMTVETGHFDVLRRSFAQVSDDQRIQAIIIAFCFGALMEALAGFGTPVAISAVMLIALGFAPLKAATVALVANTAPVAFGAVALPVITLAKVTALPVADLGSMVGRQTPLLAVFVPLVLVFIVGGRRGIAETWPVAVVAGVVFAVLQFAMANYGPLELVDIVASLGSALAVVLFVRVWHPRHVYNESEDVAARAALGGRVIAGGASESLDPAFVGRVEGHQPEVRDTATEVARAYAPYIIIIAVFSIAVTPAVKTWLASLTKMFAWPGLHVTSPTGAPLSLIQFNFNWAASPGTLLLVCGLLSMPVLGIGPGRAVRAYRQTVDQLKWAVLTVVSVLALAYVMNASGQTGTLGKFCSQVGGIFALFSPLLGWFGTALTGSDTSSNALFGALQVAAGKGNNVHPVLLAAGNSSGGVLGKMISPQNLAVGASAVGLAGKEGDLFRQVFKWTLVFLPFMCVLVYLQSTSLLGWMVP